MNEDRIITEEEMEEVSHDGNKFIVPEVLPEQQFKVMITSANLDESRANYLLHNFSNHFKEAAEWARKAKDIIVTNENQTVMMEMARTGRLFLAKKRQEIEKARKWMKEPALREGQAIDKIANLLKDTIIPTEQHLERQEKFIEFKKKAEEERLLLEAQAKMEADRIAKEQEDLEARSRLQAENEKLQKQMAIERAEAIKQADIKQKAYWAEQEKIKKENESKIAKERAEREKVEAELFAKRQAEAKAEADRLKKEADKIRAEEALASAGDEEKLLKLREDLLAIKMPTVKSIQANRIVSEAISYIYLATKNIKPRMEEEE